MSKIEEALKKARNNTRKKNESASVLDGNNSIISGSAKNIAKIKPSSHIESMKEETGITDEDLNNTSLIIRNLNQPKVTNSFRNLRTQLLNNAKDENFIVLVTSCASGEDSAFVSMNLGAAFSFDEAKTSLVIDCDINSHKLEEMLSIEYDYGLVDFLEDDSINVNEILNDVGIRRLRVIPSGVKQNKECEYFTKARMKVLLDGLVERYHDRYIVLNSPALNESADASILVDLVDYVVVVVPYGCVTDSDLDEALNKIDKSKLLGVILNDVPNWV